MKFRIPLFLWLSSMLAGVVFLLLGFFGAPYAIWYLGPVMESSLSSAELQLVLEGFPMGLRWLGLMLGLGSTLLYLFRKKLSTKAFSGIFAILLVLSTLVASYIATL